MNARLKRVLKAGRRLTEDLVYAAFGVRSTEQWDVVRFRARAKDYPQFHAADICAWLAEQGIGKGNTVLIHSSWDRFVNFNGSPKVLIDALMDHLGPEGTLAMPAFPRPQDHSKVFDVRRTLSGAGFLTEIFRRYPGVRRSINLNHSVCAIGPNADYLVRDHHRSRTSFDECSPYLRLKDVNAFVVGFGVGHHLRVATALHCVDSLLREEIEFFARLFGDEITYRYKDENGTLGTHTYLWKNRCFLWPKKVARHMSADCLREGFVSNLPVYSIPARYLIDRALELAKRGLTMYAYPIPWFWLFSKGKLRV
jgi:aminoglycoside 3-N-acetyltransferase